jgi:hypothetical protein
MPEILIILKSIPQDITINGHSIHIKYPLFLSDFNKA